LFPQALRQCVSCDNYFEGGVDHDVGRVAARVAAIGVDHVCTSIVVAAELRFGAARHGSATLTARRCLQSLGVRSLESPADRFYADLRTQLEVAGTPIGANDLLFAAHALALGHILVTDNEREFARVKSLSLENWLR
jgi:tRNA(fMet)-specific endonuclease VapC